MKSRKKPPHHNALKLADQDYTDNLSPEHKQYVREFNEAFYRGNFDSAVGKRFSDEQRRETYNANRPRRETVNLEWSKDTADVEPPGQAPDPLEILEALEGATPETLQALQATLAESTEYLDHPKYKAVLQMLRDAQPEPGLKGLPKKAYFMRVQKHLEGLVRLGKSDVNLLDEE